VEKKVKNVKKRKKRDLNKKTFKTFITSMVVKATDNDRFYRLQRNEEKN